MTKDTTKTAAVASSIMLLDDWFDPIEDGVPARVRGFGTDKLTRPGRKPCVTFSEIMPVQSQRAMSPWPPS